MIKMEVVSEGFLSKALLQLKLVQDAMETAVYQEGEEIKKLFEQTTQHWNKNKFKGFTKEDKRTKAEITSTVGSDDRIYAFINYGTSERYAVMSGDWSSQTTPRVLGSQPGQGTVIARGRRAVPNPMPGIQGRHWDEEIVKKRKPVFIKNLEAATFNAVKIKAT
jgi:hypothetical protein